MDERARDWLGSSSAGLPPALVGAGMVDEGEALRLWLAEQERRRSLEQLRAAAERQANLQNPSQWQGEVGLRSRYRGYEGQNTGPGDQTILTPSGWATTRGFIPNPEQTRDRIARRLRRRTYEKI